AHHGVLHSFPTRRSSDLAVHSPVKIHQKWTVLLPTLHAMWRKTLLLQAWLTAVRSRFPTQSAWRNPPPSWLKPSVLKKCLQNSRSEEHTSELQSRENLVC